jgi:MFS family permease
MKQEPKLPYTGAQARPGVFRALSYRNYRLFFFGQGISLIGTWMQQVAMSWLVYRLTGSALLLGTVGFTSQIPTFLVAPFAGVLADRCNRRHLLLATQGLAMTQAFALSYLYPVCWNHCSYTCDPVIAYAIENSSFSATFARACRRFDRRGRCSLCP